jgi:hypothetical protein
MSPQRPARPDGQALAGGRKRQRRRNKAHEQEQWGCDSLCATRSNGILRGIRTIFCQPSPVLPGPGAHFLNFQKRSLQYAPRAVIASVQLDRPIQSLQAPCRHVQEQIRQHSVHVHELDMFVALPGDRVILCRFSSAS